MKRFLTALLIIISTFSYSQAPCEFLSNVTDSIGTYRETREILMYERVFGAAKSYVFFSMAQTDGMPVLNAQFIDKSPDFIRARCLDKNSRMFLQLDNGKVVTLIHIDQDNCGSTVRTEDGTNNRIMNGVFMFMQGSIEDLKQSPISIIRVRYSTESSDYIIKSELKAEFDSKTYSPSRYFMDLLHCFEN